MTSIKEMRAETLMRNPHKLYLQLLGSRPWKQPVEVPDRFGLEQPN